MGYRPEWHAYAKCGEHLANTGEDLWFAPDSEQPKQRFERVAKARRICDQCPVARVCEAAGMDPGNLGGGYRWDTGIYGGMTEDERRLAAAGVRAPGAGEPLTADEEEAAVKAAAVELRRNGKQGSRIQISGYLRVAGIRIDDRRIDYVLRSWRTEREITGRARRAGEREMAS